MDDRGYAKGRAKRAEILDAAVAAFGEMGFRGASLRDIAARCGISHPGLKHHFPTKEALLLAVLERRDETARAAARAEAATGAQELSRIVDLVATNASSPDIVELFATVSAEATAPGHPAHAFFAERYRRTVGWVVEAYQAARDDGALREDVTPEAAARELVALMDGLQVQWLYEPDAVDMAGIVSAHLRRQLVAPGGPG